MKQFTRRLALVGMTLGLCIVVVCLISVFFVQSWRYTEAGKVPPKTAVLLHAVNEQLLPSGLKTPAFFANKTPPTIERVDAQMETGDGDYIPLRIYKPIAEGPHPVIVYYHGGAFMEGFGNIETHDNIIRSLAARTKAIVVAPGYRLAPDHVFPAAVNDSYEALEWVVENRTTLEADLDQLAVAGDSAGGNLAAVVAYKAKEKNGPHIKSEALLYPLTTFEDIELDSRITYDSGYYFLSRAVMEMARDVYTPNESDWISPYTSPLLAEDLSDMPDTLIVTGEFDPLRDEGELLATRLNAAQTYVEAVRFDGVMHGFVSFYEVMDRGEKAMQLLAAFFHRSFANELSLEENEPFEIQLYTEQDSWMDEVEAYAMGLYLLGRHMQRWFE